MIYWVDCFLFMYVYFKSNFVVKICIFFNLILYKELSYLFLDRFENCSNLFECFSDLLF